MNVSVIGAGYVGLVQAAGLAALGHRVVIGEIDAERVHTLEGGDSPFREPGLAELLKSGTLAGTLQFTTDNVAAIKSARIVFLTLPTPEGADGAADLSIVEGVVDEIGGKLEPGTVLVLKSTVPVGTADRVQEHLDQVGTSGIVVVSNPEFLAEGSAVSDFMTPSRIVIGARVREAADVLADVYQGLDAPVVFTDPTSAEMIKYASNAYLATRVTFGNAIANVCEAIGADVMDVLRGMGHDERIGHHFMKPGPGFGGSCFPKDTKALVSIARAAGYRFSLLEGVIEVNEAQHHLVVDKVRAAAGGDLTGKTVGMLGLAYKAGTADLRGSPALELARLIHAAGAKVHAFDPAVQSELADIVMVGSTMEAARGADVLLIATEWPEFAEMDVEAVGELLAGDAVVDARNLLDPAVVRSAGLRYWGVGR